MSTKVSNLTKSVIKNYPDFHVREDLDYTDDGRKVYGYDYKGLLPITTLRTQNVTYLDIEFWRYVNSGNFSFAYEEIPDSVHSASSKFSSVSEIDMEDLTETCEFILKTIDELDEKAWNEPLNMSQVEARVDTELSILFELKASMEKLPWWKVKESEIKVIHSAFNNSLEVIDELLEMKRCLSLSWGYSTKEKREAYYKVKRDGYLKFTLDSMAIKTMMRILASV